MTGIVGTHQMVGWLDRWFGVGAAGSTIGREAIGGLTTFLTMSYIAVVNPVFLEDPRDRQLLDRDMLLSELKRGGT